MTALAVLGSMIGGGCAHHQHNQYAYAPPLAPPVYPQPQATQPAMGAAPVYATAPPIQPGTLPAGAVPMAAPAVAGQVVGGDPCCPPLDGGAMPVVYESVGQTTPCPPGP